MRVYVPATTAVLRVLLDDGQLRAPLTACAVTAGMREWYAEGDEEELEYAALIEAARLSLRMLDEDPTAARRRVVLAAEVDDGAVTPRPDLDRAVVAVDAPIPLRLIAAAHVDDADAEAAVARAADGDRRRSG